MERVSDSGEELLVGMFVLRTALCVYITQVNTKAICHSLH